MLRLPGQKQLNVPVTFPSILSKSRDYNSIEILLLTIFNYFYILSEESRNIHNPKRCKVSLLPLLAEYFRYEYTDVKDIDMEREIIAAVPELHHNKGIATGINNALSLSKKDKTNDVSIPWFYEKETNIITVIIFDGLETYKMMELLNLVVPLGTKVVLKPGFSIKASEEIDMHSWTEVNFGPLDPNKQYYVTPNNYWKTEWNPEDQLYHTYVDYQRNIGNNGLELQNGEISDNIAGTRTGNIETSSNDVKTNEQGE